MSKKLKKKLEGIAVIGVSIAFLAGILYLPVPMGKMAMNHSFAGTVLDEKGNPANGVKVTMAGNEHSYTVSSKNGKYCLSGKFTSNEWKQPKKLSFASRGCVTANFTIKKLFFTNEDGNYDLGIVKMAKAGSNGSISGDIALKEGAKPLFGTVVKLYDGLNATKGSCRTTATDKHGHYVFKVKPGYYTLVIKDSDFKIDYVRPIVLSGGKNMKIRSIAATKETKIEYHDDFWNGYLWYFIGRASRR